MIDCPMPMFVFFLVHFLKGPVLRKILQCIIIKVSFIQKYSLKTNHNCHEIVLFLSLHVALDLFDALVTCVVLGGRGSGGNVIASPN